MTELNKKQIGNILAAETTSDMIMAMKDLIANLAASGPETYGTEVTDVIQTLYKAAWEPVLAARKEAGYQQYYNTCGVEATLLYIASDIYTAIDVPSLALADLSYMTEVFEHADDMQADDVVPTVSAVTAHCREKYGLLTDPNQHYVIAHIASPVLIETAEQYRTAYGDILFINADDDDEFLQYYSADFVYELIASVVVREKGMRGARRMLTRTFIPPQEYDFIDRDTIESAYIQHIAYGLSYGSDVPYADGDGPEAKEWHEYVVKLLQEKTKGTT